MEYFELYHLLKSKVNYQDDAILIDDHTRLVNRDFESKSFTILPGDKLTSSLADSSVEDVDDIHIVENRKFRYQIFQPTEVNRSKDVILMFHGLNEKYWTKYLPWAKRLSEITGKTLLLFPIAFHMNRAPQTWSDRRMMQAICEKRMKQYPEIMHSTISNVAISSRLHLHPQRLFWSGLQTYYDVIQLLDEIKSGQHPDIDKDASFDVFSYSIGCLLSEILFMADDKGYFKDSRLCMFCGGAVFNRLSPVSKFILDSEANVALYSYVVEHLENHLKKEPHLASYLNNRPEGLQFRTMLDYKVNMAERENSFRKLSERMMAITLAKDTVVPYYEVINTLQGNLRNIPVRVEVLDFAYPYRHEDPFPAKKAIAKQVNEEFERIMGLAAEFLG